MSTERPAWKPGDKALVEVVVGRPWPDGHAMVHDESGVLYAVMPTAALIPVPAAGEVEAATEDVLARAVMGALQCDVMPACREDCGMDCDGDHEERECYEHPDPENVPFTGDVCRLAQSVVDAIRPLLAGGVPERSEAETEWGVRCDRVHDDGSVCGEVLPGPHNLGRAAAIEGWTLVSREVHRGAWLPAARVAGTTEAPKPMAYGWGGSGAWPAGAAGTTEPTEFDRRVQQVADETYAAKQAARQKARGTTEAGDE